MFAIALRFLAGRCHGTPWGRHVNEADVGWPPEPWRLLRALVATWHRKADHERFPEASLTALLERLGEEAPVYRLPESAVHAHSRHYMPTRDSRTLVFDAFLRLDPAEPLVVAWPGADPPPNELELADHLLARLGYLGRAESWVEAERLGEWDVGQANCRPGELGIDPDTGEVLEPVTLLSPMPRAEFAAQRRHWRTEGIKPLKPALARLVGATLGGDRLTDALRVETADLQAAGWSLPPGSRRVLYHRAGLRPTARPATGPGSGPGRAVAAVVAAATTAVGAAPLTTARLVLAGRPLPRLEDAIRIGEMTRAALQHICDKKLGRPVPPELSGHGASRDPSHPNAFFLPEDADGDGFIDHLLIHAGAGLDATARATLERLDRLYRADGVWRVALEGFGSAQDFASVCRLTETALMWRSVTPCLNPWYAKPGFWSADQIRRECRRRGLPELVALEELPVILVRGRERRPVHFRRWRDKPGVSQPDQLGRFWRLVFAEPVPGPLALGFGCHFGLGMFVPEDAGEEDGTGRAE